MSNSLETSAFPAGVAASPLERDLVAILRVDGSPARKLNWSVPLLALPLALLAGAVTTGVVRNDGWVSATNGAAANREHRARHASAPVAPRPRDVADRPAPSRQATLSRFRPSQIETPVIADVQDRLASAEVIQPTVVVAEAAEPERVRNNDQTEPRAAPSLIDESEGIRAAAVASQPLRPEISEMSLYEPPQNLALQQESRREMVDEIRFLRLR